MNVLTAPPAPVRDRRLDLDRAKGVAILIVVVGHIVAAEPPRGAEWYDTLRYAIYRFHMPFFLYLSGYVMVLSGALRTTDAQLPRYAWRRAQRLLVPFLLLGTVVLVGKLVAQRFVHVDNRPGGLLDGLRDLVLTTEDSPATFIWFLWVLFLCCVVAPPVWRRLGTMGLVAGGLVLLALEPPAIAYLDRFARHAVFFAIGVAVAEREARLLPLFAARQPLWWLVFAAALAAAIAGWLPGDWSLLLCGLAAIPALHGLMFTAPLLRQSWPLTLGRYTMAIYLFNVIAIGVAKAILMKMGVPWTAEGFWIHAPVLTAAGLIGPILGKAMVLRRLPVLDRMTD
ncbi:acyltransferase family protein [Falsiroseomonas oryziterrae]|uniref:acyltransferase family protein n=1 Tax=Falsiroseomonas oryziterrae TaxID=2911368 RepID=UPI001F4715B9|nr:acyltransferase [Roseomonas sp. NPKOSM-4]